MKTRAVPRLEHENSMALVAKPLDGSYRGVPQLR